MLLRSKNSQLKMSNRITMTKASNRYYFLPGLGVCDKKVGELKSGIFNNRIPNN